jgi:hypothetical protein
MQRGAARLLPAATPVIATQSETKGKQSSPAFAKSAPSTIAGLWMASPPFRGAMTFYNSSPDALPQ